MPVGRYAPADTAIPDLPDRQWPLRRLSRPPLWSSVDLRDGNQALPEPMDPFRKAALFELLVSMGFKDIEVGYPSASKADFDFVRHLVRNDLVPDDVRISVFTLARPDLIERTYASLAGARSAMVHLCNATAPEWRATVFRMTRREILRLTLDAAAQVLRQSDLTPGTELRFEYSPETFNATEPEFALEVCNAVTALWDASPDRPVTVNLPATVETTTPNVFADQVEWMHRNLERRDALILSVHPHNDRGTAVAATELALMAGADRVEGTLFGNGERTGNVCLATVGLNLFAQGVDPQLDFSDIDGIRRTVEWCTRIPVHPRHPYAGDLVYTAFSGTHQDAIKKGFEVLDRAAGGSAARLGDQPWRVPYLPVDPADVGRSYEAVVRINSQSGKGGISYLMKKEFGLDLPRPFQVELAAEVQAASDDQGTEIDAKKLWDVLVDGFTDAAGPVRVLRHSAGDLISVTIEHRGRTDLVRGEGRGPDASAAFLAAAARCGIDAEIRESAGHAAGLKVVAYRCTSVGGRPCWGAGIADSAAKAELRALAASVSRALRQGEEAAR
jgi:2-isopropylmalate synthase